MKVNLNLQINELTDEKIDRILQLVKILPKSSNDGINIKWLLNISCSDYKSDDPIYQVMESKQ